MLNEALFKTEEIEYLVASLDRIHTCEQECGADLGKRNPFETAFDCIMDTLKEAISELEEITKGCTKC
jgi:hypothetical protein